MIASAASLGAAEPFNAVGVLLFPAIMEVNRGVPQQNLSSNTFLPTYIIVGGRVLLWSNRGFKGNSAGSHPFWWLFHQQRLARIHNCKLTCRLARRAVPGSACFFVFCSTCSDYLGVHDATHDQVVFMSQDVARRQILLTMASNHLALSQIGADGERFCIE